jgi:ATP-dependent DNA helicase DinG
MLLAEAGTGTGKTLGYLPPPRCGRGQRRHGLGQHLHQGAATPASPRGRRVWGESTAVVVRKGRENYLCLLNLEDALQSGSARRLWRPRGNPGATGRPLGRLFRMAT